MSKAVLLISGGVDSVTLLHYIIKELDYKKVFCLSFNYNQKHLRELKCAKANIDKFKDYVHYDILDISFMGSFLSEQSSLVSGGVKVPALQDIKKDLDQPITYVPNRNMMMLSIATSYAESKSCYEVFYAAQSQDSYGYWDCTEQFLERVNKTLALNRRQSVQVKAPFTSWSKSKVVAKGLELGVDYQDTWTCYRGGSSPCRECPSCIERDEAFIKNGCVDPLLKKN